MRRVAAMGFVSLFLLAPCPLRAEAPAEGEVAPEVDLEAEEAALEQPTPVEYATAYIRSFHESVCPGRRPACVASIEATRRWQDAPELAALIVEAAKEKGVPWAVLLVLVRAESSFKTSAVGDIGERGLVQVHGEAARGYDLTTARGQLLAGAAWYAYSRERCGDRLRALRAYQSGSCRREVAGAAWRLEEISRVEADYRGDRVAQQ